MARADHTPYLQALRLLLLAATALWLSPLGARAQSPAAHAAPDPATQLAQHCFERAQAAYFEGRLAEARRGFECAYKQLPSPEMAWNLARVNERMGDVEAGVRYFREYLASAKPRRPPSPRPCSCQRRPSFTTIWP
jgi:hypothetical protein